MIMEVADLIKYYIPEAVEDVVEYKEWDRVEMNWMKWDILTLDVDDEELLHTVYWDNDSFSYENPDNLTLINGNEL